MEKPEQRLKRKERKAGGSAAAARGAVDPRVKARKLSAADLLYLNSVHIMMRVLIS